MGDSACIVHSFSYAPAIPNESKQGNLMLALGESVSFGRFMNESLSWEKWSTFSQKNYVEEAERYAQPGSVAQKKAFFEAHYKRAAAKKVAVLVEHGNANELEGVVHDNDEQVRLDVDVGRMEEKAEQAMDCKVHSSVIVEETSKDGGHGSICEDDVLEESHRDTVSSLRSRTSKLDQPLQKQDFVLSEYGVSEKGDTSTLAKQVLPHHEQDSCGAKSLRKPSVDSMDTRVSSAKSSSAIVNLNLVKELKEGPISAHNSTMAHEDHETLSNNPIMARAESESINLAVTLQSETDRTGSPLNSSTSGSRSASRKRHLLSAIFSKSLIERSASTRKQKLEEKFNASEVQKMEQHKTKKDQVGNRFSKLSCIFCFKASPTLDEKESEDRMEHCTVSALPPPPTSIANNLSMGNGKGNAKFHTKSFTATIATSK